MDRVDYDNNRDSSDIHHVVKEMQEIVKVLKSIVQHSTNLMQKVHEVVSISAEAEKARLKSLEIETEKSEVASDVDNAQLIRTKSPPPVLQQGPGARCYRCNISGHISHECPLKDTGLWFCYYCQELTFHKGTECAKSEDAPHLRKKPGFQKRSDNNYRGLDKNKINSYKRGDKNDDSFRGIDRSKNDSYRRNEKIENSYRGVDRSKGDSFKRYSKPYDLPSKSKYEKSRD